MDRLRTPPIPDWRDKIKAGDVLVTKGGSHRVVRKATYSKRSGLLSSVVLTIKKCSWTGRCYTVMNRSDIKWRGYSKANYTKTDMTLMDKRINRAVNDREYRGLDCCDVKGIP